MDCLYCGEKLSLLSSKDRQFCNKKHQELFRQREADMSIQRLKEAFSFASSPSKSKQPSTSLLDQPGSEIPPDPEFTSQEPHDGPRRLEAPSGRSPAYQPPAYQPPPESNPNVIYCGPATEQDAASQRDAPPNAGFAAPDEQRGAFRLPFFIRRPEPGESGAGADSLMARQLVHERAGQLEAAFGPGIAIIDVWTTGQPGHSDPVPSPDLHLGELQRKAIADQIRKLAFAVSAAPAEVEIVAQPGPEIAVEQLQEIPAGSSREFSSREVSSQEIPQPALATYQALPIALRSREGELRPAVMPSSEIIPASVSRSTAQHPKVSFSSAAIEQLPVARVRVRPVPFHSAFQALGAGGNAPVRPRRAKTETDAASTSAAAFEALSVPSERLAPVPPDSAFQSLGAGKSAPARPRRAKTDTDAAPTSAAEFEALSVPSERLTPVPPDSAFQSLGVGESAPARPRRAKTDTDAALQSGSNLAQLPVVPRTPALPALRACSASTAMPAFAPCRENSAAGIYAAPKPVQEVRPGTIRARVAQPPASVACRRDTVFASLPRPVVWQLQAAAASRTPLDLAIPRTRQAPALFQGAVRGFAARPAAHAPHTNASAPLIESSHQKVRARLTIPSRELVVQSYTRPRALIERHAFVLTGTQPAHLRAAALPVPEIQPLLCEVWPKVAARPMMKRPVAHQPMVAMVARHPKVIAASLPARSAAQTPSTAVPQRTSSPRERARRISSRELQQLRRSNVPSPLLQKQAFVVSFKEQARAQGACWPVPELQPPAFEVRPRVTRRAEANRPPVVTPYPNIVLAGSPRRVARPQEIARAATSPAPSALIGRVHAALSNSAFQSIESQRSLPVQRAHRSAQPAADFSFGELPGKPVQVESRKLQLQKYDAAMDTSRAVPFAEAHRGRIASTADRAFEVRPMPIRRPKSARQPAVAKYRRAVAASFAGPTVARPLVAGIQRSEAHRLTVALRQAIPIPCGSPLHALSQFAPAAPRQTRAAATWLTASSDIALSIYDRYPYFMAEASTSHPSSAAPASQPASHAPEFLAAAAKCSVVCPSRSIPSWDPEWLGPQQYVRWPGWLSPAVRSPHGAIFTRNAAGGRLALSAAGATSSLIRVAAWTEASESLNQSALLLQLPRRAGDAVLVQIRPAPVPPAPADRPVRVATRTLAARGAPAGAKRPMQWVSVAVPWRPLP